MMERQELGIYRYLYRYMWKEGKAIPTLDIDEFMEWELSGSHIENHRVAYTNLKPQGYVSTIFLTVDCNFYDDGPPILWETLVLDGNLPDARILYQARYRTREEAEAGHRVVVEMVNSSPRFQALLHRRGPGWEPASIDEAS